MKRVISVFLALLLLITASAAMADAEGSAAGRAEAADGTNGGEPVLFRDTLASWAGGFSFDESDWEGTAAVEGEESRTEYRTVFRRDGALSEIEIDGIGKLQFDGETAVLDAGGRAYVLDVAGMLSLFSSGSSAREKLEETGGVARELLGEAAREILFPVIDTEIGASGFRVHIDADTAELAERTVAYIDRAVGDENSLLGEAYPQLRAVAPQLPETFEEMKALWEENREHLRRRFRMQLGRSFRYIKADAVLSGAGREAELAVTGEFASFDGGCLFSLEYMPRRDGFTLSGSIGSTAGYGRQMTDCVLWIDADRKGLTGSLEITGTASASYTLSGSYGDGAVRAMLAGREQSAERYWDLVLDGTEDPVRQTLNLTLDRIVYQDGLLTESETVRIAALDAQYRWDMLSCTLSLPGSRAVLHGTHGRNRLHVTLSSYGEDSDSAELWVFRNGHNAYRIRAGRTRSWHGRVVSRRQLTAEVDPTGISFESSVPFSGVENAGKIRFARTGDGFEFTFEWLSDALKFLSRYPEAKLPFRVHVTRSGKQYTVDFSNTQGSNLIEAHAECTVGESCAPEKAEGTIVGRLAGDQEPWLAGGLSYVPGRLEVTNRGEERIVLEKVFESEREITYALKGDLPGGQATIAAAIDGGVLSCSASVMDQTVASMKIAPVGKTPVIPIDQTGAVFVSPQTLPQIIYSLVMD